MLPERLDGYSSQGQKGPQAKLNCKSNNRFNVCYAKLSKRSLLVSRPYEIITEIILREGSSGRHGQECCSGPSTHPTQPMSLPQAGRRMGPRPQLGFLWGSDHKRRHPRYWVWCNSVSFGARLRQNSQAAIFGFRNTNLLILVSFWSFPPGPLSLNLTNLIVSILLPALILSRLPLAQDFPVPP